MNNPWNELKKLDSENVLPMHKDQCKTLSFTLRSTTDQITKTVKKFDQLLDELSCCTSREKNEISTALSEALANAIIHGNKANPAKSVRLFIKIYKDKIQFSVIDEGRGFDPQKIQNPTVPENLMKKNGRGIYLMSLFMDEIKFSKLKNGMKVTLTKYFTK